MTLTHADLEAIKEALQPEFNKIRSETTGQFAQVRSEANQNFTTLNKKIESLKRSNRKDHNLIIKVFDEKTLELKKRIERLEDHAGLPCFKSL